MGIIRRKPHGFRCPAMPRSKRSILCALLVAVLSLPLFAQDLHYPLQDKTAARTPATPDDRVVVNQPDTPRQAHETGTCSIQPFPGLLGTVSIASLQIPSKAQKEYEDACVALKDKKLPEAEQHLRKATAIYPQYVAGWVMLGQTLETRRQAAEARDACSHAATADPNYLPAYLCLAEIAGRKQEWNEVLSQTQRALELDAVNDAYAYFFSAIAYFNLNRLSEAEASALKAESIDIERREPLLQLVLAQIYQAKNDSENAASHLREYQKLAPDAEYFNVLNKDSVGEASPK